LYAERQGVKEAERTGFEHEVATNGREVAYRKLISNTKGLEYENVVQIFI
jgi:hypothetical protein